MARRLTTFSRLLIALIIVGAIFFGAKWFMDNTEAGQKIKETANTATNGTESTSSSSSSNSSSTKTNSAPSDFAGDDDVINIGVVTWGGYAGGQYFNEGFNATKQSRFYKEYGLKVQFKILDDFEPSRAAFKMMKLIYYGQRLMHFQQKQVDSHNTIQ